MFFWDMAHFSLVSYTIIINLRNYNSQYQILFVTAPYLYW